MGMPEDRPEDARDDAVPTEGETDTDTEGHSMATYQLGLTMSRERQREAEQAARERGRFATGGPKKRRSFIDRLRGR